MSRKLKIGMHVVFLDEYRQERDALVTAIHGDPQGRQMRYLRKAASELTAEEKASGEWDMDHHRPPLYAYQIDKNGNAIVEWGDPGECWPCINLVVVSENEAAQDQYGRQIDERHTSIVHWMDNSAQGYCYRFADETVDKAMQQPTIS